MNIQANNRSRQPAFPKARPEVIDETEGAGSKQSAVEDAQRALLNILEDFAAEKNSLERGQGAMVNIFDDFDAERAHMEDVHRAVLNILADFDVEKVKVGLANEQLGKEIEERKRVEEEIHRMNGELIGANKELEAFSYSVSHDLRAPVRHIHGYSKILLEDFGPSLGPEGQKFLKRIQEATVHMGQLVDDLLNLSRLGRQEVSVQITGLEALVSEVLEELHSEIGDRQIEWKIAKLPFVECDAGLMKQVFTNLLSNAIKYTRPRDHAVIEVGQSHENGLEEIFVRDNGVGFNMKYADKLFGVFQRLHRKEDFEGTGVGLATVQRIIQKHGGRVRAEAQLDKGAAFYFSLGPRDGPLATSQIEGSVEWQETK